MRRVRNRHTGQFGSVIGREPSHPELGAVVRVQYDDKPYSATVAASALIELSEDDEGYYADPAKMHRARP